MHRPLRQHHADHFRNHIAGAAHHHGVAHAHVLALHFVFVVQRGVGDGDAANKHRAQPRHRGQRASAAHLHVDGFHHGQRFLRRVFVRHRPARLAGAKTQLALQRQAVDLVHHAVDVKRQTVAQLGHALVKRRQPGGAGHHFAHLAHWQAKRRQRVQHAGVGVGHGVPAGHLAQAVGKKRQRPLRGDFRVELAHRAGGGVARIDKGFFAARQQAGVQRLEVVAAHIHLAAHFQQGRRGAVQP